MQVSVIPLTSFMHDRINAHVGVPLMMVESLARDLERRGLVRVAMVPRRVDEALTLGAGAAIIETAAGKAPDDGQGPPSSASAVAQALAMGTLLLPKSGGGKHRKSGT